MFSNISSKTAKILLFEKLLKNACNELCLRGYDVDTGIIESFDISAKTKKQQEENSLLRIKDSFRKIIIQKSGIIPHYDENGIYIVSLKDFLLTNTLF